jgi:ribonuclease P protein component
VSVESRRPRGYPPEARIRRKAEYKRTFEGGLSVRDALLKLVVARRAPGDPGPARLGTAVSRRVGGAVERNRARRRIREAFRLVRRELPAGLDLIAIPLETAREPALAQLERSLLALAKKALARLDAREKAPPAAPPP